LKEVGVFSEEPQVSPGQRWILVNSSKGAEVWDAGGGGKYLDVHRPNDHASVMIGGLYQMSHSSKAQFSPDDRWVIASGLSSSQPVSPVQAIFSGKWNSLNGTESHPVCRLWDVENREEVATFRGCCGAALSPDGRTLLIEDDKDRLRLYDVPPPRPWGVPLALTIATWTFALALCWAVKRRVRRWRASLAAAPPGEAQPSP
jgi:hypothetical protein